MRVTISRRDTADTAITVGSSLHLQSFSELSPGTEVDVSLVLEYSYGGLMLIESYIEMGGTH